MIPVPGVSISELNLVMNLMYSGKYYIPGNQVTAFEHALQTLDARFIQRNVISYGTIYNIAISTDNIFDSRYTFVNSNVEQDLSFKVGEEIVKTYSSIAYIHCRTVREQWCAIAECRTLEFPDNISMSGVLEAVELITFGMLINKMPSGELIKAIEFLKIDGWDAPKATNVMVEDPFEHVYHIQHNQEFNIGE